MPHDRVARITPERLFETGSGKLPLAPARRSQAPGSRSERIPWRLLGRAVVQCERLVITVRELEGVPELHPRDGAARPSEASELFGFVASTTEVALEAEDSDEQPPRRCVFRMGPQALLEQRLRVGVALAIGEQRSLTENVGLCRTPRKEPYRYEQRREPRRHLPMVVL